MFSREEKKRLGEEMRNAFDRLNKSQAQKLIKELKEKVIALENICSYLAYDPISKEFKVFAHQKVEGVVYFYMLKLEEAQFDDEEIYFDIWYALQVYPCEI